MENLMLPVSVIIPTHNSAETIERAIESVLKQDMLPKEIIVVDDCSTDNTVELVRTISTPDTVELKLVRLDTNLGPSVARNAGWNVANCEFIAFLDSDDSWHPMKLRIQTGWMANNPEIQVTGHLIGDTQRVLLAKDLLIRTFRLRDFLIKNRISTPTVMIRRSVTSRFDPKLRFAEDYGLWLRLLATYEIVVRIETPLAQLHKAKFGESGLSSKIFRMYRGELTAVTDVWKKHHISLLTLTTTCSWLSLKFIVRVARTTIRKIA
jgi:glycosyltransferase involved in cell wall biosynthesis